LIAPSIGQDIRPVGSDIALGSKVLTSQSRLGAAEVGLLAAVGAVEVEVYCLPKVAILSTGDEVIFS
jgi:molybdopterin biosynthesis enzyme